MKKSLITLALVLLGLNAAMAQSTLLATLSHEGEVSLFYGYNAFVDAMAASDHGDVITLSSGLFAPSTITKAVTIRGAAMYDDAENGILKTQLNGNVEIRIPDETNGNSLTMEYLYLENLYNYSTLQNPKFQHLRVSCFNTDQSGGWVKNALLANISGAIENWYSDECSLTIINSDISRLCYHYNACQCNVINSVVRFESAYYINNYVSYITFKNCIFPNPVGVLNGTNTCDHCLAIVEEGNSDILANMIGTNWTVNRSSDIFTGEGLYVLTAGAGQTYLGTDGEQVGIWGGPMPWQTTALNPTITKCQVSNRTTSDGKLSVEIEVAGVE